MMFGLEPFWVPYARIRHSVLTGEPAFDQVYGTSVYQYLSGHPDQASLFGAAAAGFHGQAIAQIADAHDFPVTARWSTSAAARAPCWPPSCDGIPRWTGCCSTGPT